MSVIRTHQDDALYMDPRSIALNLFRCDVYFSSKLTVVPLSKVKWNVFSLNLF